MISQNIISNFERNVLIFFKNPYTFLYTHKNQPRPIVNDR